MVNLLMSVLLCYFLEPKCQRDKKIVAMLMLTVITFTFHHDGREINATVSLNNRVRVSFQTSVSLSKTGVYRGIYFLIALTHRLWVLVRTASLRRF